MSTIFQGPRVSSSSGCRTHVDYISGSASEFVLWVQDLDQNEQRAIVGPTAIQRTKPFWSPDNQRFILRLRESKGSRKVRGFEGSKFETKFEGQSP